MFGSLDKDPFNLHLEVMSSETWQALIPRIQDDCDERRTLVSESEAARGAAGDGKFTGKAPSDRVSGRFAQLSLKLQRNSGSYDTWTTGVGR